MKSLSQLATQYPPRQEGVFYNQDTKKWVVRIGIKNVHNSGYHIITYNHYLSYEEAEKVFQEKKYFKNNNL